MNTLHSPLSTSKSRRGMALVIVLAIIVLVLGLCVGFLARVSTERNSSKGYASAVDARLLGASAVQIVQGQIDAATTQGTKVAWSSQPGLIRTYDDSGSAAKSYKLYSSGTMQTAGPLNPSTEAASMAGWFNNPALYTDINAPVDAHYTGTADTWPILDPSSLAAGATNPPQGFSISGAPTGAYKSFTNPAPMPVQWLYVLKDGQIVAPTGSGNTATVAGADKSPIVGRIAFWTDDETCKVNVNTASEGSYWDIPRFNNFTERNLGIYQPVKNEFQGYPGHPAGVSLSTVFPELVSTTAASANDKIFDLTPRITAGGSLNLTRPATDSLTPVTLDPDRLYATTQELIFKNDRSPNDGLTKAELERAKFFVTTVSRAPEVNLFNLPKVVCWPLHSNATSNRSAFDKLIAFCGTLNGEPYYFQRQNKDSTTEDYTGIARNQTLYSYLQNLTGRNTPGFGGSLASKLGADRDQVLTEIFDYIRCANLNDLNLADTTKQFAPGTGNRAVGQGEVAPITIGATRGFGRYTTISEVAVWLICTADPVDTQTGAGHPNPNGMLGSNAPGNLTLPSGVLLTKNDAAGTKQIRIEAALLLDPFTPMHGSVAMHPDIEVTIDGLEDWTIQGNSDSSAVNLEFPSLSRQTDADAGVFRFGTNASWVSSMPNTGGYMGTNWAFLQRQSRARNAGRLAKDSGFDGSIDSSGVKNKQNPFVSEPVTVTVTKTSPKVTIVGPPITISIRARTTGEVIQTIEMEFPSTVAPAPKLSPTKAWSFQQTGAGVGPTAATASTGRFTSGTPSVDTSGSYYDVIYSLVASKSGTSQTLDPRFLAMEKNVDKSLFSRHPKANGANYFAHSVISNPISGFGGYVPGAANGNTGTLANLGTGNFYPYAWSPCPKVPFPANAAMANGDWDNGTGPLPDGGFLNEPDQGNLAARTDTVLDFGYATPYFSVHNKISGISSTFTSPSRTMPSPGMFGSLPTGFKRGLGWQTLLFRRQPSHPGYSAANGGFISNPDFLFLDLFWMPVVEPYAISEPLSTAGKINMNTQIIPFTWIQRDTGIYAVLKNEKVPAAPTGDFQIFKIDASGGADPSTPNYRRPVKIPETLEQFRQRFDNSDGTGLYAFRTAAEICDIHIIPQNATPDTSSRAALDSSMASFWASHALTGDNSRERIYTTVYPRLTTKSNTFTVHFRAQALKQVPGATPGQWIEGRDVITADYRGSTTIERFIDPNDPAMPANLDYASNPDATPTLDSLYHWRVRSHHQFAP